MAIDHFVQMDAEPVADQETVDNPALFEFVDWLLAWEAPDILAGVIDEPLSEETARFNEASLNAPLSKAPPATPRRPHITLGE